MVKYYRIVLILLISAGYGAFAQPLSFVENRGQWSEPFDYRLDLGAATLFLEGQRLSVHLHNNDYQRAHKVHREPDEEYHPPTAVQHHAYRVEFVGAADPEPEAGEIRNTYHNYLLGRDPGRWQARVPLCGSVTYRDLYPGIDLRYYITATGAFKYDLIVHPGADPGQIKLRYTGVEGLHLEREDLVVPNTVQDLREAAPLAYTSENKEEVKCHFRLRQDELSFKLGRYPDDQTLVIDPELIFSTYTGSRSNNFGYTATYAANGDLYAGGIVYNDGLQYPTTFGAFQTQPQGGEVDVAISRFSADGRNMVYSTYLGGAGNEMPYSMIELEDGSLLVMGSTGSMDFPIAGNAYQSSFKGGAVRGFYGASIAINYLGGSDLFLVRLGPSGGQLKAGSLFGGTGNDGFNLQLNFNYGDFFRGEVIATADKVFLASSTFSEDLPTTPGAMQTGHGGGQDGFLACLDTGLSTLYWCTYVGGGGDDNALSLRHEPESNSIFACGGTSNASIFPSGGGYRDSGIGGVDGYIVALSALDGSFEAGTYNGTDDRDVNYYLDLDADHNVYIFGQSLGDYPVSDGLYANPGSSQFLHQLDPTLSQSLKSTVFGDGDNEKNNLSPTAFMVGECGNLFLSGWGGGNNVVRYGQGTTYGLPITDQAFKSHTDGNDFYFMVLDVTWKKLNYATYFGGSNDEHVDGGTSRFHPDGTIYQALCAGCLGQSEMPTTSMAYSPVNGSSGCNMAALKFRMEAGEVLAELAADRDSSCVPYTAQIRNLSYNADTYEWLLPNGNLVFGQMPSYQVTQMGAHSLRLIARDTTCNLVDTTYLNLYGFKDSIHAAFTANYDSCSNYFKVAFENNSWDADTFYWDFGDGHISHLSSPVHTYSNPGDYRVQLVAGNSYCERLDSLQEHFRFKKRISNATFNMKHEPCEASDVKFKAVGTEFQEYLWDFGDGQSAEGPLVEHHFDEPGTYRVRLELRDSLCQRYLEHDTVVVVRPPGYTPELPNVFTPNGDGINDFFGLPDDLPTEWFSAYQLEVFNRWGGEVFRSQNPDRPWDGNARGEEMPEAVYFYKLQYRDDCQALQTFEGFVHLSR